jgi:hypothetical protein
MHDVSKPEDFVTHYARMLPDSDSTELQKILEMRNMRRTEQTQIVQIYRTRIEGVAPTTTTASSAMPSAFSAMTDALTPFSDSSMRRLEKLVKKKL